MYVWRRTSVGNTPFHCKPYRPTASSDGVGVHAGWQKHAPQSARGYNSNPKREQASTHRPRHPQRSEAVQLNHSPPRDDEEVAVAADTLDERAQERQLLLLSRVLRCGKNSGGTECSSGWAQGCMLSWSVLDRNWAVQRRRQRRLAAGLS